MKPEREREREINSYMRARKMQSFERFVIAPFLFSLSPFVPRLDIFVVSF